MDKVMFFVHYKWTGNGIEELTKHRPGYRKMVNEHFKKIRHKACEALSELYSNADCMKYIIIKRNKVLSTIEDEMFKLHFDKNGEIVGDLIGTDSSVRMEFIRVSDDWEIRK